MNFEIRLYPSASYDADVETTLLGAPGEIVLAFEADYPMAALTAAEPTIITTRLETTSRTQRGKRVTLTTFTLCAEAVAAWQTARGLMALVVVDDAAASSETEPCPLPTPDGMVSP